MSRGAVVIAGAALLTTGCFSPEVSVDDSSTGATGSPTGSTTAASGATDTEDPGTDGEETSDAETEADSDNQPPQVVLELDGNEAPSAVLTHGVRVLSATVTDEAPPTQVEFLVDGTSLATLSSPPFEIELAMTSLDTGTHEYSAVATDEGGLLGSDTLDLSVNIVGGTVEDLNDSLFLGGLYDAGASQIAGGGLVADEGGVFLAGASADDEGVLLRANSALTVQWEERLGDGFRSEPALGDGGRLVVAGPDTGNWRAHVFDANGGKSLASWTLGSIPATGAGLGPKLAVFDERLDINENPTDVVRFGDLEGNMRSALYEPGDLINDIAISVDGSTTYIAYGGEFGLSDVPCSNSARRCVVAIRDGNLVWEVGLTDLAPGVVHIAPAPDDGVFAAVNVHAPAPGSYLLTRISDNGEILDETWHGEEALDTALEEGDRVISSTAHPGGGIVVCGTYGPPVAGLGETGLTPIAFAALFDANLELVWETRGIVPPQLGGAYTLGCAANSQDAFVFGLRGQGLSEDGNPIVEGDVWLARLRL